VSVASAGPRASSVRLSTSRKGKAVATGAAAAAAAESVAAAPAPQPPRPPQLPPQARSAGNAVDEAPSNAHHASAEYSAPALLPVAQPAVVANGGESQSV